MNKKRLILNFLPSIILLFIIFIFSSQKANVSNSNSFQVLYLLKNIGIDLQSSLGLHTANFIVRKIAHVMEYFILSCFIYRGYKKSEFNNPLIYTFATIFTLACLDEIHQTFVPGRDGRFRDVLVDSIGVILLTAFLKVKTYFKI